MSAIKKTVSVNLVRRFVQIGAILLLMVPWFGVPMIWTGNYVASHLFGIGLADPLAAIETMLASRAFYLTSFLSALPLIIMAVILGRVFCGWVCPVHTLLEWAHTASPKWPFSKKPMKKSIILPTSILLVSLIGSLWIAIPLFTTVSPIGALSRVFYFGVVLELLLVLIVVLLEFFQPMFWCRRLCPVGILYGWLGVGKLVGITLDNDQCNDCGICQKECSMQVEPGGKGIYNAVSCMSCGKCVTVCSRNALRFSLKKYWKRNEEEHGIPTQL
ncbi:MAG: 4Fe-4S binding protein [Gracilibacteraceae bacterium]|jgi:ferredoxin-type protein NapH|nr:4Fe-4S binding protein [Gracilibacteraceae bacterium]